MLLELWRVFLLHLLFVLFCLIFPSFLFFIIFSYGDDLLNGPFWCDNERFHCCLVALRVAVEHVTSILTVGLAESPTERFAHQFRRQLVSVFSPELVHLGADLKWRVFVISVSFVLFSKLRLSFEIFHFRISIAFCCIFLKLERRFGLIILCVRSIGAFI